jgi:hypothetical protein
VIICHLIVHMLAIVQNKKMNSIFNTQLCLKKLIHISMPQSIIFMEFFCHTKVGSPLPFQTRLTQTKPVIPLSKEHDLQVKDQGRR